jgi:hypothetical protein
MSGLRRFVLNQETQEWEVRYDRDYTMEHQHSLYYTTIPLINRMGADWTTAVQIIQNLLHQRSLRRHILNQYAKAPPTMRQIACVIHPLLFTPIILDLKDDDAKFRWKLQIHLGIERRNERER